MKKIAMMLGCITIVLILLDVMRENSGQWLSVRAMENRIIGLKTYTSQVDKDQDGIDDQTDIIQSTRAYLATDPIYMSKYYGSGYPDDGYGVCTDVVGFSVLGAGYDLMTLVNQHVLEHRELYDIEIVDLNIDFRRVTNLIVYFRQNHIELTTDPMQIDKWQAGDIVVFDGHVGIISDKRTIRGIPLVIHHTEKDPHIREENLLQTRTDIVAHFRIS